MDQNWLSGFVGTSGGGHNLHDRIDRNQLNALATVLIGICQLPLAFIFTENWIPIFIIGSGGWLLIGIGVYMFQRKVAFDIRWFGGKWGAWLSTAVLAMYAIAVVAATVAVLMT